MKDSSKKPQPQLITVVGVGALGSHFIQFARNFKARFRVIDFDVIEAKNVQSQFHSKTNIRKLKADALRQTMEFLYGTTSINSVITNKLTSLNEEQLLGNSNLIVDCLDNGASREIVQNYARRTNTPCVHGALAANGAFGRVIWSENFIIDHETTTDQPTCEDGEHLPFIAVVSAWLARSVQEFLLTGRKVGYSIAPTGTFAV